MMRTGTGPSIDASFLVLKGGCDQAGLDLDSHHVAACGPGLAHWQVFGSCPATRTQWQSQAALSSPSCLVPAEGSLGGQLVEHECHVRA